MNKPPEIVSTLADPEGRKTLRNLLRGFPERVYPVGNLEYSASGVVFLTNDGDFAAEMLKRWENVEQVYHIKVKGMLMRQDLERLGKEIGAKLQTLRQPDATRGKTANFWYEVRMYSSKKEEMRMRTSYQKFARSEEHTSELQSPDHLVCRLLLEKKKK